MVYTSAAFDEVLRRAEAVGVSVEFAERGRQSRIEIINLLVVLAGFVVLGYLVSRGLNGQSSSGSLGDEAVSTTTFANVAGNEGTVAELREIVEFLKSPGKFDKVGARVPEGRADVRPARARARRSWPARWPGRAGCPSSRFRAPRSPVS